MLGCLESAEVENACFTMGNEVSLGEI